MPDIKTAIQSEVQAATAKAVVAAVDDRTTPITSGGSGPQTSAAAADIGADAASKAIVNIIAILRNSTNAEPWYQSRVFWGLAVTLVGYGLAKAGLALSPELRAALPDILVTLGPSIPVVAGSLYALYGRFVARAAKPIGA